VHKSRFGSRQRCPSSEDCHGAEPCNQLHSYRQIGSGGEAKTHSVLDLRGIASVRDLGFSSSFSAQELMRHSSCRTTLDVYTRAVDQQKREASLKVVKMMLPLDVENFQHPSAPSGTQKGIRRCRRIAVKEGLIGGPDRDRTDDLFHAITGISSNCSRSRRVCLIRSGACFRGCQVSLTLPILPNGDDFSAVNSLQLFKLDE
jgi:hypothetical protein